MNRLSVDTSNNFPNANEISSSSTLTAINRFNLFLSDLEKKYPKPNKNTPTDQKAKNFSFGLVSPSNNHIQTIKEENGDEPLDFKQTKGIEALRQAAQSVYIKRKEKERQSSINPERYHTTESVQIMLDRMQMKDTQKAVKMQLIREQMEKENENKLRNAPEISINSIKIGI